MNTENPLVTIIVRTKDRPKLLKRALQSIADQTYRPIEVVLVNDGGCDLDLQDISNILRDVSLNYVRLEQNTGRAHAGNVGIKYAKGDYIGFLDDDDEFYPDHVNTLISFFNSNIHYAAVYSDSFLSRIDYDDENDEIKERDKYVYYSQDFSYDLLLLENYIPLNCIIFKRSILEMLCGFDESFELYEDWDLLIRVAEKGNFHHLPKVTSAFRQWSDTAQITLRERKESTDQKSYLQLMSKHKEMITPVVVYKYFVLSGTRHGYIIKLRQELESLRSQYHTLEKRNTATLQNMEELQKANRELQNVNKELRDMNKELRDMNLNLRNAERELKIYNQHLLYDLAELKNSFGWSLLESYRKWKEKISPRGSRRRDFYEMALKVAKTFRNEGFQSVRSKVIKRIKLRIKETEIFDSENKNKRSPTILFDTWRCRKPVDIIIPVFNGLNELRQCIESVLALSDLTFHNLIIIEDKSTDKEIYNYLTTLRSGINGNVKIIFNSENLGFVKTVNRGIAESFNDVVLLNSDTVVTANWIEKMQRAAYSKSSIATVTPFSNHAYLCSIPEPLKYNFLPNGFTLSSFGDFIDRISLRYYPEIPFGSGFCLYIKRVILDLIGFFDEELFEKGYGEDTDFCLRAREQGFLNILDDSTFIYHKGGVSFESDKDSVALAEKNRMIARNLMKLRNKHPQYDNLLVEAVETTLKPIHDYLHLRLNNNNQL